MNWIQSKWAKWAALIFIIALILWFLLKRSKPVPVDSLQGYNTGSTWDDVTNEKIQTLHPQVQPYARAFVNELESRLGIRFRIYDAKRDCERQNQYVLDGVSNAECGESYHQYGLAIDGVEIREGVAIWNNSRWEEIAEVANEIGFEWGGHWITFSDKPHFQMTFGKSVSELLAMFPDFNTSDYQFT